MCQAGHKTTNSLTGIHVFTRLHDIIFPPLIWLLLCSVGNILCSTSFRRSIPKDI